MANACIFLGWGICAPIAGYVSDRIKRRRLPMIIGALLAAAVAVTILYVPDLPKWSIFILMFALGAAYSSQPIVFAVAREISPVRASGTAVATTNMLVMLGGVFMQPFVGRLLDWFGDSQFINGVHVYSISNYQFALTFLPIGLVIAAVLAYILPETFGECYERELKEC